jgi:hypothetical protein
MLVSIRNSEFNLDALSSLLGNHTCQAFRNSKDKNSRSPSRVDLSNAPSTRCSESHVVEVMCQRDGVTKCDEAGITALSHSSIVNMPEHMPDASTTLFESQRPNTEHESTEFQRSEAVCCQWGP